MLEMKFSVVLASVLVFSVLAVAHAGVTQNSAATDIEGWLSPTPYHAIEAGADDYAWGRYKQPIPDPNLSAPKWRLKRWHYLSLNNGRWFVGMAIADLGYLTNAWVYVMDKDEGPGGVNGGEYKATVPLGVGLSFASSSISGETTWRNLGNYMGLRADPEEGYTVNLHVNLNGRTLDGRCAIDMPKESMALLYPLAYSQPAYTHKAAGLPIEGRLLLGDEELVFFKNNSFAAMDWTRSHTERVTTWKWASFAGQTSNSTTVGINLSAEVYEGHENAFWLNGQVVLVGPVDFTLPAPEHLKIEKWTVRSSNNDAVQLEFTPYTAREEHINAGIIASDYVQIGGTFSGRIDVGALKAANDQSSSIPDGVVVLDGVLGVVENHYAKW